jgi:hypothetical protein
MYGGKEFKEEAVMCQKGCVGCRNVSAENTTTALESNGKSGNRNEEKRQIMRLASFVIRHF